MLAQAEQEAYDDELREGFGQPLPEAEPLATPRWVQCPACREIYDASIIPPPLVSLTIRCACCCQ